MNEERKKQQISYYFTTLHNLLKSEIESEWKRKKSLIKCKYTRPTRTYSFHVFYIVAGLFFFFFFFSSFRYFCVFFFSFSSRITLNNCCFRKPTLYLAILCVSYVRPLSALPLSLALLTKYIPRKSFSPNHKHTHTK